MMKVPKHKITVIKGIASLPVLVPFMVIGEMYYKMSFKGLSGRRAFVAGLKEVTDEVITTVKMIPNYWKNGGDK